MEFLFLVKMALNYMESGSANMQAWNGPQMAAYGSNQTVVDKVLPEMLHLIDPHWLVTLIF